MNHPEHYVPPPPPYEHSLQHDQKVANVQALGSEVSKGSPFRDEDKDSKRSAAFSDKCAGDYALSKRPAKLANGNLRASRPLPPSPVGARPRSQGGKCGSATEMKSCAVQNEHAIKTRALPPFSPLGPPIDESPCKQKMPHLDTSIPPTPLYYPPQPSHDAPRRSRDERWPVPPYPPVEPDTSFRRPSHTSTLSPSYSKPQGNDSGARARLLFDPSVAYSDSQPNTGAAYPVQRETATSLYSSAVSSHLHPDVISASRSYAPLRPALRNSDITRLDKTDRWSSRYTPPPAPPYPSSPTSVYTSLSNESRTRTQSTYECEQRWAISESDITRDVYRA